MCFPGCGGPIYAGVHLEDRPRVYQPSYNRPYYPYGYPSAGYGVARGVYYAPAKIRVRGPKYVAPQYGGYGGYGMAPGYGYGYGAGIQAPYCEPPQEKVKYRYVPAGRQPDRAEGRKTDGTYQRLWRGKTKNEVQQENFLVAMNNGIYRDEDVAPYDPAGDDMFWCQGPKGESPELLSHFTIMETMIPGKWKKDPRYGNLYFISEKKKDKLH